MHGLQWISGFRSTSVRRRWLPGWWQRVAATVVESSGSSGTGFRTATTASSGISTGTPAIANSRQAACVVFLSSVPIKADNCMFSNWLCLVHASYCVTHAVRRYYVLARGHCTRCLTSSLFARRLYLRTPYIIGTYMYTRIVMLMFLVCFFRDIVLYYVELYKMAALDAK